MIIPIEEESKQVGQECNDRASITSQSTNKQNENQQKPTTTTTKVTALRGLKKPTTLAKPSQTTVKTTTTTITNAVSQVINKTLVQPKTRNDTIVNENRQETQNVLQTQRRLETQASRLNTEYNHIEDDDDYTESVLENSMDLQETQTLSCSTMQKQDSKHNSASKDSQQSNKVYNTTPSKLQTKFGIAQPSAQSINKKQQNIRPSTIQSKKTITNLQESSKPLVQLELNLAMTNLAQLSKEQLTNQNLRSIDLRNNRLTSLPDELFTLLNLWKLQLDNNQIQELPELFEQIKALKLLTVSNNQLTHIPQSLINSSSNLEKLDVSQNKITEIPENIGQMQKLKILFLQDNAISYIPSSLHMITNLQQLGLDWGLYLSPKFEKVIKSEADNSYTSLTKFLEILKKQSNQPQVDYLKVLFCYYKIENDYDTLFNSNLIQKSQSVFHTICQHNHAYLFDHLSKEQKQEIDINQCNKQGQTSLVIALSQKSDLLVDKILREFKESLDLDNCCSQSISQLDISHVKQLQQVHPLMIAVQKQMIEYAIRILAIMVKNYQRSKLENSLNLNMKDQDRNTLLHHLFQNFSTNMELNVELCQELLKQSEREGPTPLRLNDINKNGSTPIDIAIETKQNQALEFAIYYNRNLLPAFQTNQQKKLKFDINCNKNVKGITPLHRAINVQNYKAIYLLLSSNECNLLTKDKEYKSAKDHCQKILFLNKYLRKGEANFIRKHLSENLQLQPDFDPIKQRLTLQSKIIIHNNINFFQLSKRQNRIKYNSWYTRLEHKNMLSSSQQQTLEQKEEEELEPVRLEDLNENVEDEEGMNEEIKESLLNEISSLKTSQQSISGSSKDKKINTPIPQNLKSSTLSNSRAQKATSQLHQVHSLQDKRASIQKDSKKSSQVKSDVSMKNSFMTTKTNNQEGKKNHQHKPSLDTKKKIQQSPIINFSALNNSIDSNYTAGGHRGSITNQKEPIGDADSTHFEEVQDYEEEDFESPSQMPSNKFRYVLNANSSAFSRRPYYKLLQKNKYERDYCIIMDSKTPLSIKISMVYQLYSQIQYVSELDIKALRELLTFFKYEIEEKDENILPLKNEISYFQDLLQGNNDQGFVCIKKNAHISLEKGPLPSIQETVIEDLQQNNIKLDINKSKFGFKSTKQSQPQSFLTSQQRHLNTNTSQKNILESSQTQLNQQSQNQPQQNQSSVQEPKTTPSLLQQKQTIQKQSITNTNQSSSLKQPSSSTTVNTDQKQPTTSNTTSIGLKQPATTMKKKESTIKKIEVKVQEQTSTTTNDKSNKKPLTINSNIPQNKIQAPVNVSKLSTPSSSKGFTQSSNTNKSQIQPPSNRSNSNPRNSIIGENTLKSQVKETVTTTQNKQDVNTSSQQIATSQKSASSSITTATNQSVTSSIGSKLKTPSKIPTTFKGSKTTLRK